MECAQRVENTAHFPLCKAPPPRYIIICNQIALAARAYELISSRGGMDSYLVIRYNMGAVVRERDGRARNVTHIQPQMT